MEHTLRVPDQILEEEAYDQLPPKDKAVYMEKMLEEILCLNKEKGALHPN